MRDPRTYCDTGRGCADFAIPSQVNFSGKALKLAVVSGRARDLLDRPLRGRRPLAIAVYSCVADGLPWERQSPDWRVGGWK